MRQTLLLVCFIGLALLTAALLSFPVYRILHLFTDIPFHKVISQLSSLCGLLFVFLYLAFNNILNVNTAGFNIAGSHVSGDLIRGIGLGILIILVLETALLLLGIHIPEPELVVSPGFIFIMVIKAALAGIMVALIEEILYRGALLGGLVETTGILNAVLFSSLVYSAVHFISFPRIHADVDISWQTGPVSLAGAFHRFMDPAILDSFLALFAFGVLLALVRLYKGNILQCIGIHAGVVMTIKIANDLTDYNRDTGLEFLVNTYNHQLGYLALGWLCIFIFAYYRFILSSRSAIKHAHTAR